jgi:hypothetical protein
MIGGQTESMNIGLSVIQDGLLSIKAGRAGVGRAF